jgi:N-acyl-D-amino-acid deacylase
MHTRRHFLGTSALLLTHDGQAPAAEGIPATGPHSPQLAGLDRLFTKFLRDNDMPGVGVAISRHGKLVYARGFGYADVEKKKPVEPGSLFRLASISKPITAVGILHLVDTGKVKLDDLVLDHMKLKAFRHPGLEPDPRWGKITIRHCLQHTGGWDRDRKGGFDPIGIPWKIKKTMELKHPPTPNDIVRYMMGLHLDFDPGSKMVYSNLGYLVLGRVIEQVTGARYEPWMRRNILARIHAGGMSLGKALPENRPEREVRYYDSHDAKGSCLYPPREGEKVPFPDGAENVEGYEAHGGWISSPVDLVRFACAFDYGKKSPLLSAEAIKEMWARPAGAAGFNGKGKPRDVYYGCGWEVRPIDKSGKANTWHEGYISGTSTLLVRRWDGLNWAVLFNREENKKKQPPADLIDPLMHETVDAVERWPDIDLFGDFVPPK